jgi:hypothetical protein
MRALGLETSAHGMALNYAVSWETIGTPLILPITPRRIVNRGISSWPFSTDRSRPVFHFRGVEEFRFGSAIVGVSLKRYANREGDGVYPVPSRECAHPMLCAQIQRQTAAIGADRCIFLIVLRIDHCEDRTGETRAGVGQLPKSQ